MKEDGYEYRVLQRFRWLLDAGSDQSPRPWSEWDHRVTNGGRGRPYGSLGIARGVLARVRRDNNRRASTREFEYRVQRRPVSNDWTDVELKEDNSG